MFKDLNLDQEVQKIIQKAKEKLESSREPNYKVKTIFIADLVGATAGKERFGHKKGMNRCHYHNTIAAETVKRFNGTVIKFIGDAVLAEFHDNLNAVMAAVVFRAALESLRLPGDEFQVPIETRVTLTNGAVEELDIESGYDIGGQVVDKAARLQELASTGQILAEVGVIDSIRLMLEQVPFLKIPGNTDTSEIKLKGLKEPVRVVEITTIDKPFGYPPSSPGHYISNLLDGVSHSNSRIWLWLRNMKSRSERQEMGLLQDRLVEAQKRGVKVCILHNGWDAESLRTAAEMEESGLKVRFCETYGDYSIHLLDRNVIIFGSKKQDTFFMKNEQRKMISYHVNSAIAADFQLRWTGSISSRLQMAKILDTTFKNIGAKIERDEIIDHLHDSFGIDKGTFFEGLSVLLGFIRKIRCIFIVGKPGTGKTSIRLRLAMELENSLGAKTKSFDDNDRLKEMFKMDFNGQRFIPQCGGGFIVKDPDLLAEVLKNISFECVSTTGTHITSLIEFERGSYSEAFASFDSKILEKTVVIHVTCDKEMIYKRLQSRAKAGGANVTKEVMEKFYKEDDAPGVCKERGIPCIEVDNNGSINELDAKVEIIINRLKSLADEIYQ
jgi:class 3 adenylate cyclase